MFYQNLNLSLHRIPISMWVFKNSTKSLHNHKYKQCSIHRAWKRYTEMISSITNLFQMKTSITSTSRHYFLDTPSGRTYTQNKITKFEGVKSSYRDEIYIYTHLDNWCWHNHIWNSHELQTPSFVKKKDHVKIRRWRIKGIFYISESIHI